MLSITTLNFEYYKDNLYFHDYKIQKIVNHDDGFSLHLNMFDYDFINSINKTKTFNEGFLKDNYIISFFGVVANELINLKAKIDNYSFQIIDLNLECVDNKILVSLLLDDLSGQHIDLESLSFRCASINIE